MPKKYTQPIPREFISSLLRPLTQSAHFQFHLIYPFEQWSCTVKLHGSFLIGIGYIFHLLSSTKLFAFVFRLHLKLYSM